MYRGITSEGICREVIAMLECAILNRLHMRQSLAVPELALLQTARSLTKTLNNLALMDLPHVQFRIDTTKTGYSGYMPSNDVILRGILPGLRYVVSQHVSAAKKAEALKNRAKNGPRVLVARRPNSHENPQAFPLDPYGNSDFFCKLCSKELSNVYMHCDGCEVLLNKDFNICVDCHAEGLYKANIQMHPLNPRRHSTTNHTGNMTYDRSSRCPCKNGPVCRQCLFCAGCSCKCHQWFTLHRRFFNVEKENSLVQRVEAVVGDAPLPYSEEVVPRLKAAAVPLAQALLPSFTPSSDAAPGETDIGTNPVSIANKNSKQTKKRSATPRAPDSLHKPKRQRKEEAKSTGEREEKSGASRRRQLCEKAQLVSLQTPPKALKRKLDGVLNAEMLQRILSDFDAGQRPHDLRPSNCSPLVPASRDDISDGALAFTEPKGDYSSIERGGNILGFEQSGPESLSEFLRKARKLNPRSPSDLRKLLPADCTLTENDARHLFRNFGDSKEVRGENVGTKKFARDFYPPGNSRFFCMGS